MNCISMYYLSIVPHETGPPTFRNNMDYCITKSSLRSPLGEMSLRLWYQDSGALPGYVSYLLETYPCKFFPRKASSVLNLLPNSNKYSGYCGIHCFKYIPGLPHFVY